jgi:hypothetical protein
MKFHECSETVQAAVIEMLDIWADPEVDEDDRDMALSTIREALFPESPIDVAEIGGCE